MMNVIPQLSFQLGLAAAGGTFPPAGGSATLPMLFPGDMLTFTVSGADLLGQGVLHFGSSIFFAAPIATATGTFIIADLIVPASTIAEFVSEAGGTPLFFLPDSNSFGPPSIAGNTSVLRLTVVPEPSVVGLAASAATVGLYRRSRQTQQILL